jgi:hypothetical protein
MKTVFLLALFAVFFQQTPPQPTGRIEGYGRVLGLGPYMSPDVFAAVEKFAGPVVVPPNGNVTVDVPLIPR